MRRLVWGLVLLGPITLLVGGAFLLMWVPNCCSTRASNDRNARATLKTLVCAQADFRGKDRDGDGRQEYWRADVAGLYGLLPKGSDERIKLIELSAAAADLAPVGAKGVADRDAYVTACPKAGYWFAALPFEDELGGAKDPDRFAFCAAPDSARSGKLIYAITHQGVLWELPPSDLRGLLLRFPLDPAKAGWRSSP